MTVVTVSPSVATRIFAWSRLNPTTDGTATVPPPVLAIATPPTTSAAMTANATTNGTSRCDRRRRSCRSGICAVSSGRAGGCVLVEQPGGHTTDLGGIDRPAAVGTETREHERLRAREPTRRVFECGAHCRGVRIALGGIRAAGSFNDRAEATQLRRREHRCVLARRKRADRGVGHRRNGARDRFDEDDREGVQIGAAVERRARRLLGRRVSSGAHHGTRRLGPTRLCERARQTEVGHPQDPVLVEEQVRRLDVAVHQPTHVRVFERCGDLTADMDGLSRSQRFAGVEESAEAAAPQQLEHHEGHLVIAPVVDRHDVRVVQRSGDLRLGAEASEEADVVGERGVEHFDRDPAPQPDVVRHVDATARARADRREHAVTAGEHAAGQIGDATDRHAIPTYRPPRR